MPLDASKPSDLEFVSTLGSYERQTRAYVNQLENLIGALGGAGLYRELEVPAAVSTLITGTHVSDVPVEVIKIYALAARTIDNISGGTEGQRKIFYFTDGNITFSNNQITIQLNQPIAVLNYNFTAYDWLELVLVDGVWREAQRHLSGII